jgi:hypothetical protein
MTKEPAIEASVQDDVDAPIRARGARMALEKLLQGYPAAADTISRSRGLLARRRRDLHRAMIGAEVRARLLAATSEVLIRPRDPIAAAWSYAQTCAIDTSTTAYYPDAHTPLTYASVYRLLLDALVDGTEAASKSRHRALLDTVLAAQDPTDGLFKDPAVFPYNDDSIDWWGWRHLTAHALNALALFDESIRYPLTFSRHLWPSGATASWLESLDWTRDPASTSNAVMNYGVTLQYERDYGGCPEASLAVNELLDWLDAHHDPRTGTWGAHSPTPEGRSLAVQTAYHMWVLYLYDLRPVPSLEAAIDACLATQTRQGGFGYQPNTSACEDIDSIQPLAFFSRMTTYRHAETVGALRRAGKWCVANQMRDGGFVFRIGEPFAYGGAPEFFTRAGQSNLFATWFRSLALAYILQALDGDWGLPRSTVRLSRSPGYQCWLEPAQFDALGRGSA